MKKPKIDNSGKGTNTFVDHLIRYRMPMLPSIACRISANMSAYVSDHNYVKDFEKCLVDKINYVTEKDRSRIINGTIGQSNCKLWHTVRTSRITASNAFNIVRTAKANNWSVGYAQRIINPPMLNTFAVRYGKNNEQKAIQSFESITGTRVK